MKKSCILPAIALTLMFSLASGTGGAVASQSSDGIQWSSYAEGRQRGEAENKKVFLVFNADFSSQ